MRNPKGGSEPRKPRNPESTSAPWKPRNPRSQERAKLGKKPNFGKRAKLGKKPNFDKRINPAGNLPGRRRGGDKVEINWTLKKARGRRRPTLETNATMDQWEADLNPEMPVISTPWPLKLAQFRDPGDADGKATAQDTKPKGWKLDRGRPLGPTVKFLKLRLKPGNQKITLPWRPPGKDRYRDVEIILQHLMRKYERSLQETLDSKEIDRSETLEMSPETKRAAAPYAVAKAAGAKS